jgi:antitoxin HicB
MSNPHYPFIIRPLSEAEGGGYLIEFPDLAGCVSDGATPEEALANGMDAMASWLHAAALHGDPIPEPITHQQESAFNGKILLRVPRSMHGRLVSRARQEGVSLNQLTLALVAEGMGARSLNP